MTPLEYRNKHRRCRYCQYCYIQEIPHHLTASIKWKCKVKDKTLDFNYLCGYRGMFCKVFKAEELKQ